MGLEEGFPVLYSQSGTFWAWNYFLLTRKEELSGKKSRQRGLEN